MLNMIMTFAKTKLLSIVTKVNIKDIVKQTDKLIDKQIRGSKNETEIIQEKKKYYKEPKWQTYFPFSFFYGSGKFQPLYFFITLFCFLAAGMLYVKIYGAWKAIKSGTFTPDMISTADLATVLTFASSLVILYNSSKKNKLQDTEIKSQDAN